MSRRRSGLALGALGLAAALPAQARAEEPAATMPVATSPAPQQPAPSTPAEEAPPMPATSDYKAPWDVWLNPGALLSYGFGRGGGFGARAEVSAMFYPPDWGTDDHFLGIGPLLQAQAIFKTTDDQAATSARIAVGGEVSVYTMFGAEVAYVYRTEASDFAATHALQLAPYASLGVLAITVRTTIPMSSGGYPVDVAPTLALKFPIHLTDAVRWPDFGHGRPLRTTEGKKLVAKVRDGRGWRSRGAPPAARRLVKKDRAALAEAWLADARSEHASVAAFSALALDLMALGAPARLVAGCHRAALEEVAHAEDAFALASSYAGRAFEPAELPELAGARAAANLEALVVETFVDGCVNEGAGAAAARMAEKRTKDARVRRVLRRVAREEASHAKLAWAIVEWGCERLGAARAKELLAPHLGEAEAPARGRASLPSPALAAHGRLSADEEARVAARTGRRARAKLAAVLQR